MEVIAPLLKEFGIIGVLALLVWFLVKNIVQVVQENSKATTKLTTFLEGTTTEQTRLLTEIKGDVKKNIDLTENIRDRIK